MIISKELLLKPRLEEREVDLPGVGAVRVRGLSRAETVRLGQLELGQADAFLLQRGLVQPALTPEEIDQWRDSVSADEIAPAYEMIAALSGIGPAALREAVLSFRGGAGETAGVPPGPDAGDDGGPPAGRDG